MMEKYDFCTMFHVKHQKMSVKKDVIVRKYPQKTTIYHPKICQKRMIQKPLKLKI